MLPLILGLLVAGVLEIWLIVAVSDAVGWMVALLLLIGASAAGAFVVKREGTATWRRVMSGVRAGQMPTSAVLDGALIMVAGFLLLVPGFLSDLVAVALVIPPVRAVIRARAVDAMQRRITQRMSRVSTTTFGFGDPSGFRAYRPPADDPFFDGRRSRHDDDIIDLDAEEFFVDDPIAEIDPPRTPPHAPPRDPWADPSGDQQP